MGCTRRHPVGTGRGTRKRFLRRMKDAPIEERANATYGRREVVAPVVEACRRRGYVDQVVQDWSEAGRRCPDGDTVFYRLQGLTVPAVEAYFGDVRDALLTVAEGEGLLPRQAVVAVDCHDVPYYGSDRRHAVGTKRLRGTNYAHRLATVDVVMEGKRFCLHAVPMFQTTAKASALEALLDEAARWTTVRLLLADRGFYTAACLRLLNEMEVRYVIPAIRDRAVGPLVDRAVQEARWVPGTRAYARVLEHRVGGVPTRLAVLHRPDEEEDRRTFAFVTNLPIREEDVPRLAEEYERRWGIETAYRMEESVRARTNALSYAMRLLILLLAVLLYDLWLLVNALLLAVMEDPPDRYPVTMHRFLTSLIPLLP